MHELANLKQGSRSVTEYVGEVKKLYRDLHYYHPFEPIDKNDLAIHHVWFESFVSKLFLDGLNQELNLRRQLIFSQPEWPSLDDVISSVSEDSRCQWVPEIRVPDGFYPIRRWVWNEFSTRGYVIG